MNEIGMEIGGKPPSIGRYLPSLSSSKSYFSLPQAETEQDGSPRPPQPRPRSRLPSWTTTFWVFMTLFFAATTTWLTTELHAIREQGSFATGFRKELDAAKHLIQVSEVDFKGSPKFGADGTEYVPSSHGHDDVRYVGEPSRAIDHAWALLHWGRFFLLSEDEARSAWPNEYKQFWSPKRGGYVVALEVMHTLHCLDHIRKAFYPDQYPVDSPIHGTLHRDHCLDHLRQTVLCNADLTPIPSRYYKSLDENYIDSDRPHTCRDFGRIRDWVSARFNGSLAVPPAPGTTWSMDNEWSGMSGGSGHGHGGHGH
ncbi:hypothetical protein QBC46DRAFT_397382 [Diplogelasinospora grovesii]|uniref:Uncharacterized protein n=1 Tax=Diplogelasinospora grovesii TaxID=303347 RepID=A0AAN6MYW4_9PEZI|nr:hypothetical protein QBC46DRAFT_397382 [Diplogelasinospora grovesii]